MTAYPYLHDPCWGVRIYFCCPATHETYNRLVRRFKSTELDSFDAGQCNDGIDSKGAQVVLIGLRQWTAFDPNCAGALAHECFHATEFILKHRGVEYSEATSEVYAYLLDSLVRRASSLLDQRNVDRKQDAV